MILRCLLSLVVVSTYGCLEPDGFKKNREFLVIGHRGAPHQAAENTLAAFDAAAQLGANALEVDLCVTQDAAVVIWHDRDPDDGIALARQSGLEGLLYRPAVPSLGSTLRRPVDNLLLNDFLGNYGYARDTEPRDPRIDIPLLEDFLDWLTKNRDVRSVYLDLKMASGQTAHAKMIMDRIDTARAETSSLSQVSFYFLSPHRDIVAALNAHRAHLADDELRIAWDFEKAGALTATENLGLRDISTGLTALRGETEFLNEVEDLVRARQDKRVDSVIVWTIDRRMQMGQLIFRNVDGIMTNRPELLYELWQITLE